MARILFYSPFNQRSRDTESLMIAFRKQGHHVISLSQQEGFVINDFLRANDVEAYSHIVKGTRSGAWYFLRHLIYFIRFCYRHRIDVVYSHLEPANFVASLGQYLIRARVYLCRHHIDEAHLYNFEKDFYYRLTYSLARKVIVVSEAARKFMIEQERFPASRVIHINLAYDFSLYAEPDLTQVANIRSNNPCDILLLSSCRLTTHKRPQLSIDVVKALRQRGLNVKLIILGQGELRPALEQNVVTSGLQQQVSLPGYVSNVMDYMSACDFFVHPSVLDSSCVSVKEAGLVKRPAIVCKGVGDFDEYIVHDQNGFLIDRDDFVNQAADVIAQYGNDVNGRERIGENLRTSVVSLFGIDNVVKQYDSLNKV